MIIEARTIVDGPVAVPAPRTPAARPTVPSPAPSPAPSPVPAPTSGPRSVTEPEDHPEVVATRLASQAAVVSWVGRLLLLLAVGLATLVVLL
ncbi:hypothetical protein [Actinomycetospora lemnae]|uniref:Uncharacterized protein n=1 Tax=Actinomycetospora lemnae TaxID=3019891 RepID=A0ABT5SWV6_9PSEU|nr:hypothetical protein [Actinomycetospora sp. DW7H6]MDD7967348.1 hypothetical protein [Actinomycetospora sp. DW7H6]